MSTEVENLAAILYGPKDIRVEPVPVEAPKPDEIQVRVHSVGICGTDIHYWSAGALFDKPLWRPMIIGHETSGVVIKTGEGVTEFKTGDRVHCMPAPACRKCIQCKEGNEHNCQAIKLGTLCDGQIRRILNHPVDWTIKVPENLSMDEGALIEPFVVGVYAVERGQVRPGQRIVIIGAGTIGVMVFLAAQAAGAVDICVVDISPSKLESISKVGKCKTFLATRDQKETAGKVHELLGGKPDVSFDCTCTQPGITTAIYCTKPCGKVVLAGLAPDCSLPMQFASINEIDIVPVVRYGHCYPKVVALLETGTVNLKPLVADRFPIAETQQAFNKVVSGPSNGFKVIVDCTQ